MFQCVFLVHFSTLFFYFVSIYSSFSLIRFFLIWHTYTYVQTHKHIPNVSAFDLWVFELSSVWQARTNCDMYLPTNWIDGVIKYAKTFHFLFVHWHVRMNFPLQLIQKHFFSVFEEQEEKQIMEYECWKYSISFGEIKRKQKHSYGTIRRWKKRRSKRKSGRTFLWLI